MGYQKITITINTPALSGGYYAVSTGRSITFIADSSGLEKGTFKFGTDANSTAKNLYESMVRDLNLTGVFGPVRLDSDGANSIILEILDEGTTTVTASGFGDWSGSDITTSTATETTEDVYEVTNKINVRSPYMFEVIDENTFGNVIDSARLDIYVYDFSRYSNRPTEPTYRVVSVAPQGDSTSIYFNLSEYAKDFFQKNLIGSIDSTNTQYIDVFPSVTVDGVEFSNTPEFFVGYYGYGYVEDGINPQNRKAIMMSNDTIYGFSDTFVTIPVDTNVAKEIRFLDSDDNYIGGQSISPAGFSTAEVAYINTSGNTLNTLRQAWEENTTYGIEYEENDCYLQFFKDFEIQDAAKALVSYIEQDSLGNNVERIDVLKIKTIEECKYQPVKVKFVNKFGALQNVWFYKNSSRSINTTSKSFRRNNFNHQAVGFESKGTYSQSNHQYKNLFKEGKEKITINSGFYPESHNEVFQQLMLSEDVWIEFEGDRHPVNISNSDLKFKTSVTDKLISYSLDLDFAYDKVQNIT